MGEYFMLKKCFYFTNILLIDRHYEYKTMCESNIVHRSNKRVEAQVFVDVLKN